MQAISADEVTDALLAASTALVAVAARSLSAVAEDVTLPQFRALVVLDADGPLGMTALAGELECSPSAATRLCDRLVRKNLMTRHQRGANRREIEVAVTPAGKKLVSDVRGRRRRQIAKIVDSVAPAKRVAMVDALRAFTDASVAAGAPAQPWSSGWEH